MEGRDHSDSPSPSPSPHSLPLGPFAGTSRLYEGVYNITFQSCFLLSFHLQLVGLGAVLVQGTAGVEAELEAAQVESLAQAAIARRGVLVASTTNPHRTRVVALGGLRHRHLLSRGSDSASILTVPIGEEVERTRKTILRQRWPSWRADQAVGDEEGVGVGVGVVGGQPAKSRLGGAGSREASMFVLVGSQVLMKAQAMQVMVVKTTTRTKMKMKTCSEMGVRQRHLQLREGPEETPLPMPIPAGTKMISTHLRAVVGTGDGRIPRHLLRPVVAVVTVAVKMTTSTHSKEGVFLLPRSM